jgi:hypothetical protein
VYYNSPGSDTGSNTSINAEYVVIRNGDDVSHSVSGWTVRDAAGHTYTFGTLRLGAGIWVSPSPSPSSSTLGPGVKFAGEGVLAVLWMCEPGRS